MRNEGETMRLRRSILTGLCVGATLAVIPAAAQATPPWELYKSGWTTTFPAQNLKSGGVVSVWEVGNSHPSKCEFADEEEIFNVGTKGEDKMLAFTAFCSKSGTVYPCKPHEPFRINGVGFPWFSTLVLTEDEFTKTALEIECVPGPPKAIYLESATVKPTVGVNKLKFLGGVSGEWKSGTHIIYLKGIDKLIPPAGYTKVR
jgi:hypothetical protein